MIDRTDRRDKHQPPALIKARPNAMAPGIEALEKDRFEALLQGARRMTEAIQEERPLARSPLIPRSDAAPADEGQTGLPDEAGASTAGPLADTCAPPSRQDHPTDVAEAVPGHPRQEAQDQEIDGILAGPETLATPASLDPRVLNARRKRKLQMEVKMHEDAARTMAQEQAAARPAQQLPPPSGPVAGGKAPPAPRIEAIGTVGSAVMAPRTTTTSPSPLPSPEMPENDALVLAPEQEEGTRQHRQHRSERQEIVAAEVVAAQVVQEQILAQRNMPESLPLHLLESI